MSIARESNGDGRARIELQPHDRSDFPAYERWYADPDVWNLSSWRDAPMPPEETRNLFESRGASKSDASFAIKIRGSEKVIGVVGLMNLGDHKDSADLSIIIGEQDFRGLGYGSEAIKLMLDHGFGSLALKRVSLSVFDFNEAALKTYERLGFRYEGKIVEAITREGRPHDAILMSITAEAYREI